MIHAIISCFILAMASPSFGQSSRHRLTLKDAEPLALNTPPIFRPWCKFCCPSASSAFMDERTIWIQVRCTCGKETGGGMLIDNFTVNSETGAVWEGFEQEGQPLTFKRLDAVRKRIFKPEERPRKD